MFYTHIGTMEKICPPPTLVQYSLVKERTDTTNQRGSKNTIDSLYIYTHVSIVPLWEFQLHFVITQVRKRGSFVLENVILLSLQGNFEPLQIHSSVEFLFP